MTRINPDAPRSATDDSFLSYSQKNILMKSVSLIAWVSISCVSFYFSHEIAIGAIAFATQMHVWIALTAAFSVACVALFNALIAVTSSDPIPKEYTPPPRLTTQNTHTKKTSLRRDKQNETSTSEPPRQVTFTTSSRTALPPQNAQKLPNTNASTATTPFKPTNSTISSSGINRSSFGVVTNAWSYPSDGKAVSGGEINAYMNAILKAQKRNTSDPALYELTSRICDVVANGSCGYYCIAATILHNAKIDPAFRQAIIEKVEKAFAPGAEVSLYGASRNYQALSTIKSKIVAMIKQAETERVEDILTMNNANEFDAFLRALILANFKSLPENIKEAFIQSADVEKNHPDLLVETAKKNGWIQEPIVRAIQYLLDLHMEIIQIANGQILVPEKQKQASQQQAPHGYLIYVEGQMLEHQFSLADHYVLGIPRK